MSVSVEIVSKENFSLGEGPVWMPASKTLVQVDAFAGSVVRLNPSTKEHEVIETGVTEGVVSFVIPAASDPENTFFISNDRKILKISTKGSSVVETVEEHITDVFTRFNDAKVDSKGRLWAGTMAVESAPTVLERNRGSIYCYSPKDSLGLVKKWSEITLSNGMAWSFDDKIYYYIDSMANSVDAFDFDAEKAEISNRRVLYKINEDGVVPDGMCLDTDGNLWVAVYGSGSVLNINGQTGELIRTIEIPNAPKTTSCCFGGDDYSELYVTSAWFGYSDEERKMHYNSGFTFKVTGLGVKGSPSHLLQD